jgi:hypothetical protein
MLNLFISKTGQLLTSFFFFLFLICSFKGQAQGDIHGSFQSDFQYYVADSSKGFFTPKEKIGSNTYVNLNYRYQNIDAGVRYESYFPALLGYDQRYTGSGIANRYLSYTLGNVVVTAGNFYEQFGSGLALRSYQDFNLGVDNSIDGFRVKGLLYKGFYAKGLIGEQRFFFKKGLGRVRGVDLEVNLQEIGLFSDSSQLQVIVGGSFVSKYQADNDPLLTLPENVATGAGRLNVHYKDFTMNTEYAYKINDPSFTNNLIYKDGNAFLLSLNYARNNFGISFIGKRIDNFDFRSDRSASVNDLLINYLPPVTPNLTHRLISLYPYVTQPLGELGGQIELSKKFPAETFLGGKYGTKFLFNYSTVRNIQKTTTNDRFGYTSNMFELGDKTYYEGIQVEMSKKLTSKAKIVASYFYLNADNNVLRVSDFKGVIYAHSGVLDFQYKLKSRQTLKTEIHFLGTAQDRGNWWSGLVEYDVKRFFFAISNDYNYNNPDSNLRLNYPVASAGVKSNTIRFSLSYGRQRAGVVCVGGLCRLVPATNGLSASISGSF